MKVAVAVLLVGLIACALAAEIPEAFKDKSLTKEVKDQVSTTASSDIAVPVSTTASGSDGMSSGSDFSSTSTKPGDMSKPKFCTRQYSPLCASNGKSYNNQCEFDNAQKSDPTLTVTKTGTC